MRVTRYQTQHKEPNFKKLIGSLPEELKRFDKKYTKFADKLLKDLDIDITQESTTFMNKPSLIHSAISKDDHTKFCTIAPIKALTKLKHLKNLLILTKTIVEKYIASHK